MSKADDFFRGNLVHAGFARQRAHNRLVLFRTQEGIYRTGLSNLDDTVRLSPGELTVLGGRAGTGKTAMAMQLVGAVIQQMAHNNDDGCVVFFSAEMDGETLLLREACALERVSLWDIQRGVAPDDVFHRVKNRLDQLDIHDLYIDESPAPTIEHMVDQLQMLEKPVRLVVFDYTELAGEFAKVESVRVRTISRGLKGIAKKMSCPVLTLTQLNREIEGRAEKRPAMRDLMHGGEQEPDRIMILVRPWMYDKSAPPALVECHVVKNRNGPLGQSDLYFEQSNMRFFSAVREKKNLEE